MKSNFKKSLSLVLSHEGGFVNHPKDPGGATNKGITIATYRAHVKKNGTVNDLKNITDAQVEKVYREEYWNKIKGDQLPAGVDYAVFDFAVNSGPARSAQYLQAVVGVKQDKIIGPATIAAVNKMLPAKVIADLCAKRLAFLKALSTWPTFGKGWGRRVDGVEHEAFLMAGRPIGAPPEALMPDHKVGWLGWLITNILDAIIPSRRK